jgi:hypothetical protein
MHEAGNTEYNPLLSASQHAELQEPRGLHRLCAPAGNRPLVQLLYRRYHESISALFSVRLHASELGTLLILDE